MASFDESVQVAPFTHGAAKGRSHRFRIEAKAVVLAAGCTATPVLLQHSDDLANASGQVGENLQFHPGVAIAGVFPEAVQPQFGATQGYQSLAFLDEGFKLETLWAPPPLLALRFPGLGEELQAHEKFDSDTGWLHPCMSQTTSFESVHRAAF